jgi:PKD repeat protein
MGLGSRERNTVDTINKNPSTIYLTPGTYPVKLTVGNANGNDDTTIYITIFDKPKPDFTVSSKSGCAPFSTSFTDLSIAQPGDDIVKWDWNFSDGTATGQNPKHTFLKPGTFNVTLTTTSLHGLFEFKGVQSIYNSI